MDDDFDSDADPAAAPAKLGNLLEGDSDEEEEDEEEDDDSDAPSSSGEDDDEQLSVH